MKPTNDKPFLSKERRACFFFAAGNSGGDFQMLEWTTAGLIVHPTDADREYSYDRESQIGKLDKGLDEAPKRGWSIVSMKDDWNRMDPENRN